MPVVSVEISRFVIATRNARVKDIESGWRGLLGCYCFSTCILRESDGKLERHERQLQGINIDVERMKALDDLLRLK